MPPQPIDPGEIGRLLDRHGAALAMYARQWTDAAEDCVQEAFVELASQSVAPVNPAAWLYRVVRHRALNVARGERRRKDREQGAAEQHESRPAPLGLEDRVALAELLGLLEPDEREVVVLRIWGGLNWEEIAEVVDVPRTTVQRKYVAALTTLRAGWVESPAQMSRRR